MGTRMIHIIFAKKIITEMKLITWTHIEAGIRFPLIILDLTAATKSMVGYSSFKKLIASTDLLNNRPTGVRRIASGRCKKLELPTCCWLAN
eukprot:3024910-Karenia_brevis.AAC.1